jgi:predicted transcriptional regulator
MKRLNIKQFDEKEEEIAGALISLGVSRKAAMALAYLQDTNSATSPDFERAAGLRQPEVSLAMRELIERDWITEREEKKPGKGRPYKIYSLKIGFDKIIAQLEKENKKAVDEAQGKVERLKELGKK